MDVPVLLPGDFNYLDPELAVKMSDGLVGISGDLQAERLLAAYRQGIFPWFAEQGYFFWFAVAPRTVLLPPHLHIGRSLAKTLRRKAYRVTVNHDFEAVIAACAAVPRPGQDGTWIAPEFQAAYTALHHLGRAHSFECWYPDGQGGWQLAGGFYGVQIGRVFYGESMFAAAADASKIAFACAVPFLAGCGIELIDCQQDTRHLARFGSEPMDFSAFQAALRRLNALPLETAILPGTVRENPCAAGQAT